LSGVQSARITTVRLSRGGTTYAKGSVRGNAATVRLSALRPVRKGRYTLSIGIVDGTGRPSTITTPVNVR
jgi:hypothetical protein